MKIAALPQVLFDEFPSDDSIKVCILTRPHYPLPDLSQYVGKLLLYCNDTTIRTIGSFPKKIPFSLFRLLPEDEQNRKKWEIIDETAIEGLTTKLAVTCIPTGTAINSVMLLIYTIDDPNHLSLYTGMFKESRELLLSNTVLKYKSKIADVYFDNTMAGSHHKDINKHQASEEIKKVIDNYPGYEIHLQMEAFDSLDLVVELASQHRINVKLSELQQIYFHKSRYHWLFDFDPQLLQLLGNSKRTNEHFHLKNRPKIHIKTVKTFDLTKYKWLFEKHKIINIKLIGTENDNLQDTTHNGLIYISYSSHAGAYTLSNIFNTIEPQRVHPIVHDENMNIPEIILNEGCEIISDFDEDLNVHEVTMSDISSTRRKSRSFLAASTNLSGTLSQALSQLNEDHANVSESHSGSSIDHQSSESSVCIIEPFIEVITVDSDSDDSLALDCGAIQPVEGAKKRSSSSCASSQTKLKIRKLNQNDNDKENSEANHRLSPR